MFLFLKLDTPYKIIIGLYNLAASLTQLNALRSTISNCVCRINVAHLHTIYYVLKTIEM